MCMVACLLASVTWEIATDRVKSLVEVSREPTVVAGNAVPTSSTDGDDACGTAGNLTDTCKRLDNIERCLDEGSANEAIARVDVAERRLVVLQNMQDDDRMRSEEAVQRLQNHVTSVGHDTTTNARMLKHFQEFQDEDHEPAELQRHVGKPDLGTADG